MKACWHFEPTCARPPDEQRCSGCRPNKEPPIRDEINLPPPLRLKVFSKAGGICAKCGKRIDGSREQWAAVRTTSGGDDSPGNFAPVHVQCGAEPVADAASDVQHKARTSWPNQRS